MVVLKTLLATTSLIISVATSPVALHREDYPPPQKHEWDCGEVNVFYTGLPAYHKHVIEQGYPPEKADAAIRNSTREMIAAGYNVAMILAGPEQPMSKLASKMEGRHWHVTGVGFGMRASGDLEMTRRLEENLLLFRHHGPTVFNYNPFSFLWSVDRYFPIKEDCTSKPGDDLGYVELCGDECIFPDDKPQ